MALTRITSNVIKDATIQEGKFDKTYLDATNNDIATSKITFQADLEAKFGTTGNVYFKCSQNLVSITAADVGDSALSIIRGDLGLDAGSITLVGTNVVNTPYLNLGNGGEASPAFYFGSGFAATGIYHIDTDANTGAVDTIGISVAGTKKLTLTENDITFNSRQLKILTANSVFDTAISYDSTSSTIRYGGATNLLEIYTGGDIVVNVRSVDGTGSEYPSSENRVGINTTSPTATLDVNGTIRADSYQNLTLDSLPTITPAKGGTGLTQIGQPEQLLRVNQAGTELEYFTDNPGDVSNLAGFGVTGDPNIYHVTARDALGGAGNALRLTTSNVATFSAHTADVPQYVKVFGINTTSIEQYDSSTAGTTVYSTWKNQIDDVAASFCSAQGASNSAAINYTYYAALLNFKTGIVSSLKKLKHSSANTQDYITNDSLSSFNEQKYNSLSIYRPDAQHGVLLYRYTSDVQGVVDREGNNLPGHLNSKLNLIAILGQRDIGSSTTVLFTYRDYGPYDKTTWGDFNSDSSYSDTYQKIKTIPCQLAVADVSNFGPYPGWAERKVAAVDRNNNIITVTDPAAADSLFDNTDLSSAYIDNDKIQIVHDDTASLEKVVMSVIAKGLNSLLLLGGTYHVKNLIIPDNFSLNGSGKATVIKKQYFDTSYQGTASPEYSRYYSAIWMRNPWGSIGSYGNYTEGNNLYSKNTSAAIKDSSIKSLVIDGNYNSNIRLGDSTRPDSNALVYLEDADNCSLESVDVKNSVGDGVYAKNANRLSIQNTAVFDNSITYITFDNPLQATDATVLKVSDSAFLSNPGPADITTTQVVAFNSCIIRNSGTGLRTYGSRSANVENNLILGPDDEWIPSSDIYDSDFNSINITCDKFTATGTGGPLELTYLEDNVAKDMTNVTLSSYVRKVVTDNLGNEVFTGNFLTYTPPGGSAKSVVRASYSDQVNGIVQIQIPAGSDPANPTEYAVDNIPYRFNSALGTPNYSFLVYYVNGLEKVSIGGPDNYIINGVIGYNNVDQHYTIQINAEFLGDFVEGDIVTLQEHNPVTGYSLPGDLVISDIRFQSQSYVLDLYSPDFNTYLQTLGINPTTEFWDTNARGYIRKDKNFTIAKGVIGVV